MAAHVCVEICLLLTLRILYWRGSRYIGMRHPNTNTFCHISYSRASTKISRNLTEKLFVLHCVLSHKLSSAKIMCLMSFQNGLWCVQTWFYFSFKTHLYLSKYRCFAAVCENIWSYIMFSTTLRIRRSLCL